MYFGRNLDSCNKQETFNTYINIFLFWTPTKSESFIVDILYDKLDSLHYKHHVLHYAAGALQSLLFQKEQLNLCSKSNRFESLPEHSLTGKKLLVDLLSPIKGITEYYFDYAL
jgi:hypothetical protein